MPPDRDGFFNSFQRAQAHGGPWVSASDIFWHLHAPKGQTFTATRRRMRRTRDEQELYETVKVTEKSFKLFADAVEEAKTLYGVTAWKRDRLGAYHPSTDGTSDPEPCVGHGLKVCANRRKPGETMCGVHLNVIKKREERAVASRERQERWRRDDQLRKDCYAAAEKLGIPVGKGSHVSMHAEDFLALCRELEELRRFRESA